MNYKKTSDDIYKLIQDTRGDVISTGPNQAATGKILIECVDKSDVDKIYDILVKKYPEASPRDKKKGFITINKFPVHIVSTTTKKQNWGHIAEGIVAIAVACRFLHKNSTVTEDHYDSLLEELGLEKNEHTKQSPNKNPDILDDVFIKIDIPEGARKSLYTKRDNEKYKNLVKSAIKYANSTNVSIWSRAVYNNNRYDKIEIISIGKRNQKTDLKVLITDNKGKLKPVNINLSMKTGDVGQFGQSVGSDYEKIDSFLKDIFGYEVGAENVYNELIGKNEISKAFQLAYKRVDNKIRNGIDPSILVEGIKKHATGGNKDIKMLVLGRNTKILDFEKLNAWADENSDTWDAIKKSFVSQYHEYNEGFPKITIKLEGYVEGHEDNVLFHVRARQDKSTSKGNIVYRHYIEKGALMDKLIGVEL